MDLSNIINSMGKAKSLMWIYRTSLTLRARQSTACGLSNIINSMGKAKYVMWVDRKSLKWLLWARQNTLYAFIEDVCTIDTIVLSQ